MESERRSSGGPLRYFGGHKLHVEVDPNIVALARALVPRAVRLKRTRYEPHITVIRNETPPDLRKWMSYEGIVLPFEYEPHVYNDDTYYWLRVFCPQLTAIRKELGLPASSEWSRAPDGFESFHCTVGNLKLDKSAGAK